MGAQTSVADFAVYHALWFMTARSARLAHELAPYPRINDWMARMRAFGHGTSSPMTAAEALSIAAAAQPATLRASKPFDEDPSLGSRVRIRADDYGRDPVDGELVLIDADEIALHRRDPQLGDIVVHFPRLGYDLRAA
jgi:glutathione S-transferase